MTEVTHAGRSVSQPIEKPKGCKPVQQPGSSQLCHKSLHLVVTQALGQATCKLLRSTGTKRLTPSSTGMVLRQAKDRQSPWARDPAGKLGWTAEEKASWLFSTSSFVLKCFCAHTPCVTQVLLLSAFATPMPWVMEKLQITGGYKSLAQPLTTK